VWVGMEDGGVKRVGGRGECGNGKGCVSEKEKKCIEEKRGGVGGGEKGRIREGEVNRED